MMTGRHQATFVASTDCRRFWGNYPPAGQVSQAVRINKIECRLSTTPAPAR